LRMSRIVFAKLRATVGTSLAWHEM
jgi:hypothetical protein